MHQKNPESTEWRDVWEQITHMHHTYTHTHSMNKDIHYIKKSGVWPVDQLAGTQQRYTRGKQDEVLNLSRI